MKACVKCGKEFVDTELLVCPDDNITLVNLQKDLKPGTILGDRYEVIDVIAGGGMGKVYKAKHRFIDKIVAIKTVLPNAVMSGAVLKRFQQEGDAISKLSHPNLLAVTDFFVSDDAQPYLVTDYLEGRSLQELVDSEGRLVEARALAIFRQICSGLKHAHSHGIIHRDLKPANVMLVAQDDDPEVVKIIDFGIAKVITENSKRTVLTETGDVFGSPAYMSPEQCRGKPLDARSDIYALGCILFMMLAGKPPFTGTDDVDFMYKHVHEAPPAVSGSFSAYVAAAIGKMLQKEPENRFASVAEVVEALYGGSSSIISGARAATPSPEVTSTAAADVEQAPAPLQSAAENSYATFAGIAVLALLVVIPIATMMHQRSQPAADAPTTATTTSVSTPSKTSPPPATSFQPPPPAPAPGSPPVASAPPAPVAPAPAATTAAAPRAVRPAAHRWTPPELFEAYMEQGKNALRVDDTSTARRAFNASHDIAFSFGEQDPRFIDSMEWQARTAMKMGNYTQAIQGLEYIIAIRRTTSNKQALADAESLLRTAQEELHKLDGRN